MTVSALPVRVQQQLQAAEALEAADRAARAAAVQPTVAFAADLVPAPIAPVATQPPTPVPAPPPPAPSDFEQKYKTLQGMYNADVRGLNGKLAELTSVVQSLKAAKDAAPLEQRPAFDPKDIEKFGEEMMEMVQRYVTGAVQAMDARITTFEGKVDGVTTRTAQTAEQQFYVLLDSLAPHWRAINEDQRWRVWLGQVDPVYNLTRQAALDNAFDRGDARQVANVFDSFVKSLPAAPPPQSLENQITPPNAGNPAPLVPTAKPMFSEKAITTFYNDVARGKYAGREAEQAAIELQVNTAVAEGRITR